MVAWMISAALPSASVAQENTLRLGVVTVDADEDNALAQERQLAERIASICGQHFGPWMQWLTLASQAPRPPASTGLVQNSEDAVIEIPEATRLAIDPIEDPIEAEKTQDAPGERDCQGSRSGLVIGEASEKIAEAPSAIETDEKVETDESPAQELETIESPRTESSVSSPIASKSPSPRNVRTPRALLDIESLDRKVSAPPRTLSESMKSKADEPVVKRSINASDDDLREYLAQEEPTPDSVRNSTNDQMQGVDADRAAKPDTRNSPEDGIPRSSGTESEIPDKPAVIVPAATQQRLTRVTGCLDHYLKNPETTTARSPWAVMHAILPFGADYELIGPNGRVNAIGWMCHNGLCRTQRIFTPRSEFFIPNVGGGVQGHEGQFLAILAQSQVPLDYPIQIGSKKFTVEDLVRYEMATCKEKSELTFKLIGLSYYVDAEKQWRSNDGKVWNLEKLFAEELAQPVVGSACGGTHRLMGLSFCLRQRELQGLPITGQFARGAKFVNEYIRYTWQLQNPDGSFSTNWYAGRGNEPNDERKVQTSGHMLEWLMFTVSDEELTSPRVEKAVDFLLGKIHDHRDVKWPIGPRGHATRALVLYRLRTEALLEQRSGIQARALAKERIPVASDSKTAASSPVVAPSPAVPARPSQANPSGRPANPPASRSTGRPTRRVRS